MAEPEIILELRGVTVETRWPYDAPTRNCDLSLRAGELALVKLDRLTPRSPLADVACGIVVPDEGTAAYRGVDWRHRSPDNAAATRGGIGRFFAHAGWISNLDVDENITLSQRHHTHRRLRDIDAEVLHLAKQFGVAELPRGRPHQVRSEDLRRAACIRAMMGNPKLLLLDQPTSDAGDTTAQLLAGAVAWARGTGAAVLWICNSIAGIQWLNLAPTHTLWFDEGRLVDAAGENQ